VKNGLWCRARVAGSSRSGAGRIRRAINSTPDTDGGSDGRTNDRVRPGPRAEPPFDRRQAAPRTPPGRLRAGLAALFLALAVPALAPAADETEPPSTAQPVVLDGRVLFTVTAPSDRGVSAEARAAAIAQRLELAAADATLRQVAVTPRPEADGVSFWAGKHLLLIVRPSDAAHAGVTLERYVELLTPILEQAIRDYRSERRGARLARAGGAAALILAGLGLLLAVYSRLYRWVRLRVLLGSWRRLSQVEGALAGAIEVSRMRRALAYALSALNALVWIVAVTGALEACLALFPYTRAFAAESFRLIVAPLADTGRAIVASIPSLIFVAVLVLATRIVLRVLDAVFQSIESGRRVVEGFPAEWARPTRRLVTIVVLAAAAVVAFPYIPGSGSEAFKGISILLGVLVSLGSTSVVSNFLSGLMLMYMRVLHKGDIVRIGDTIGTVVESGLMVTRLRTLRETEIAIPNLNLLNAQVTNHSRSGTALVPTAVTIGYGAPWRQVEALLERAAAATEGIRAEPVPFVVQSGLEDFYVRYELWVAPADPWDLPRTMARLHRNIQDEFNAHGVQIMSPHYMTDPATPAVVPRAHWHLPPASAPGKVEAPSDATQRVDARRPPASRS
jgi:small-conductance mechanosensitive channel